MSISSTISSGVSTASSAAKSLGGSLTSLSAPVQDPYLSKNIWTSGADDKLAATDVYSATGTSVINDIASFKSQFDTSLASIIRGGREIAKKVKAARDWINTGRAILNGKGSIVDKLLASNNQLKSGLKALGVDSPLLDGIIQGVKDSGSMMAGIEGAYNRISTTNFKDINQVGALLNDYTKDNSLFKISDLDSQVGACAGLVNACVRNGIPNSFNAAVNMIANVPDVKAAIKQVGAQVLPATLAASDANTLKDIADAIGPGGLLKVNPSVIQQFSEAYNRPFGSSTNDDATSYQQAMVAFGAVDNNWQSITRSTDAGDTDAVNLVPFLNASADFKQVLSAGALPLPLNDGTTVQKLHLLSSFYDSTSVEDELRTQFPYTVIGSNQTQSAAVKDPMTVLL